MYKQSGRKPDMLKERPVLTEIGLLMWTIYEDVKKGCDKVSYSEIESYMNVTGDILTPYEATLMLSIDVVRRNA